MNAQNSSKGSTQAAGFTVNIEALEADASVTVTAANTFACNFQNNSLDAGDFIQITVTDSKYDHFSGLYEVDDPAAGTVKGTPVEAFAASGFSDPENKYGQTVTIAKVKVAVLHFEGNGNLAYGSAHNS